MDKLELVVVGGVARMFKMSSGVLSVVEIDGVRCIMLQQETVSRSLDFGGNVFTICR